MQAAGAAMSALCLASLPSCTSISWVDASGTTHHAGLVFGRVDALSAGARLTRWSFGLDLRLSGADRGWTIGWHDVELVAPARQTATADSLGDVVLAELRDGHEGAPERGGLRWLWFSEPVSSNATLVSGDSVGAEVRAGAYAPGITVGWHRGWQLLGDALESDRTHVLWQEAGSTSIGRAVLWTLEDGGAEDCEDDANGDTR